MYIFNKIKSDFNRMYKVTSNEKKHIRYVKWLMSNSKQFKKYSPSAIKGNLNIYLRYSNNSKVFPWYS